ncbi:MAG: PDZ domain-containing protein [Verrucomicrobiaceae bacterium]|nr:PDZ domain-containing protein [Verrucomicrobiaceae bacterium]
MKTKLTLLLAIAGLGLTPSQAELTIPDSKPNAPEHQAAPQAEQKAVAYLGVLTRDVPEELRTQFSLAEGFGLLVEDVMPGSPAATAGLKPHDVLLKLADQQLVNAEQLLTLVRSRKKGENVSLSIITGGKESQITATLGEHMTSAHRPRPSSPAWNQPDMKHFFSERFQNSDMGERLRDLQNEVQKHQERMQQWNHGPKKDHLPALPPAHPREEGKKEDTTPHKAPSRVKSTFRLRSHPLRPISSAVTIRANTSSKLRTGEKPSSFAPRMAERNPGP